jgi:hypothetical protein
LGIPSDRATRAMQFAEVLQEQFETALAQPFGTTLAQPGYGVTPGSAGSAAGAGPSGAGII